MNAKKKVFSHKITLLKQKLKKRKQSNKRNIITNTTIKIISSYNKAKSTKFEWPKLNIITKRQIALGFSSSVKQCQKSFKKNMHNFYNFERNASKII